MMQSALTVRCRRGLQVCEELYWLAYKAHRQAEQEKARASGGPPPGGERHGGFGGPDGRPRGRGR
jgi:hypothetical protein